MIAKFPCTSCGQCCRNVHRLLDVTHDNPVFNDLIHRFPYKLKEDGAFGMLTDTGLCSVYDQRPLLCNLKLAALLLGLHDDDWMRWQADERNIMIEEAGLDEKFKVLL